ncbi:MAG TPA: AbrB family transcriptional regulator [Aestuariivirga sp.]|nr:AbrB family transcriptional regulator [Aestuariivirga sp.]
MISVVRALAVGTAGGALCFAIGVPAPWLAGSLVATIIAIYSNLKLDLPKFLQAAAFILLGIQTGTAVNTDTLARAAQWPLSIVCLGVTVVLIVWACIFYYERFRYWNRPTALFASLPGALSIVILLASTSGADMRRVTISQCVRLFFLIAALPAVIEFISPPPVVTSSTATVASLQEIMILVGTSAAAGLLFAWLKVPAGLILGAALVSAALGLSGVVHGGAPDSILIPANIILGVMIGLRFKGISLPELRTALGDGFAGFVIAMIIAMVGAVVTSMVADLPLALTLLAFAPGGLEAMTIMAFALNLDPAYVAAHQIARYIGLVLLMPAVTGFVLQRGVTTTRNANVEDD